MTRRRPLIVQQEKLLRSAVSDYIDRIVDGCGLRQRVITQPRPEGDILGGYCKTLELPVLGLHDSLLHSALEPSALLDDGIIHERESGPFSHQARLSALDES